MAAGGAVGTWVGGAVRAAGGATAVAAAATDSGATLGWADELGTAGRGLAGAACVLGRAKPCGMAADKFLMGSTRRATANTSSESVAQKITPTRESA